MVGTQASTGYEGLGAYREFLGHILKERRQWGEEGDTYRWPHGPWQSWVSQRSTWSRGAWWPWWALDASLALFTLRFMGTSVRAPQGHRAVPTPVPCTR